MKIAKQLFFALALITPTLASAQVELTNKVLIIGIDGVRTDALLSASTPNIDSLWRGNAGAYRFDAKTDDVTISGPSWTTMLTGVGSAKHGVKNNNMSGGHFTNYNTNYVSFMDRLEAANPTIQTAAISQWEPTNSIFSNIDYKATGNGASVKNQAVELLSGQNVTVSNPDAIFLHFDDVDGAGHSSGYLSQSAITAVQTIDGYIGEILAAVRSRDTYAEENWLIMLSSDHGGNGSSHGGSTPQEKYVWLIMNGMDVVVGEMENGILTADIAATAMVHLGLDIDPSWDLDGQVRALKDNDAARSASSLYADGASPIPEPSTYGLLAGGIIALAAVIARRRKR
ncbi:MAG: alkaline phosphatase family protein [Puniceicoccales bacterium]|jgi:predicted AlkP superfamily pyrophosphatase or phosphodiesterase|nr:alkaline phosphatase family protein [Puniceicoccales bacterium]